MSRRRLAALALVVATLAPAQASAECAWVLWMQTAAGDGSRPEWNILGALDTYARCGEAAEQSVRGLLESDSDTRQGMTVITRIGPLVVKSSLLCLPDTIDPRGPKGSR